MSLYSQKRRKRKKFHKVKKAWLSKGFSEGQPLAARASPSRRLEKARARPRLPPRPPALCAGPCATKEAGMRRVLRGGCATGAPRMRRGHCGALSPNAGRGGGTLSAPLRPFPALTERIGQKEKRIGPTLPNEKPYTQTGTFPFGLKTGYKPSREAPDAFLHPPETSPPPRPAARGRKAATHLRPEAS